MTRRTTKPGDAAAAPSDPSLLDREGLLALIDALQDRLDDQQATLDRQAALLAELQFALPGARPAAPSPSQPPAPPKKRAMKPASGAAYTLVFDGGSVNNPGRGYGSYQIVDSKGAIAAEAALEYGMGVSNNVAEYRSLIAALEAVIDLAGPQAKSSAVAVRGDSQLVIKQVKGEWKVSSPDMKPLHARVRELLGHLGPVDIQWHRRDNSVRILGH